MDVFCGIQRACSGVPGRDFAPCNNVEAQDAQDKSKPCASWIGTSSLNAEPQMCYRNAYADARPIDPRRKPSAVFSVNGPAFAGSVLPLPGHTLPAPTSVCPSNPTCAPATRWNEERVRPPPDACCNDNFGAVDVEGLVTADGSKRGCEVVLAAQNNDASATPLFTSAWMQTQCAASNRTPGEPGCYPCAAGQRPVYAGYCLDKAKHNLTDLYGVGVNGCDDGSGGTPYTPGKDRALFHCAPQDYTCEDGKCVENRDPFRKGQFETKAACQNVCGKQFDDCPPSYVRLETGECVQPESRGIAKCVSGASCGPTYATNCESGTCWAKVVAPAGAYVCAGAEGLVQCQPDDDAYLHRHGMQGCPPGTSDPRCLRAIANDAETGAKQWSTKSGFCFGPEFDVSHSRCDASSPRIAYKASASPAGTRTQPRKRKKPAGVGGWLARVLQNKKKVRTRTRTTAQNRVGADARGTARMVPASTGDARQLDLNIPSGLYPDAPTRQACEAKCAADPACAASRFQSNQGTALCTYETWANLTPSKHRLVPQQSSSVQTQDSLKQTCAVARNAQTLVPGPAGVVYGDPANAAARMSLHDAEQRVLSSSDADKDVVGLMRDDSEDASAASTAWLIRRGDAPSKVLTVHNQSSRRYRAYFAQRCCTWRAEPQGAGFYTVNEEEKAADRDEAKEACLRDPECVAVQCPVDASQRKCFLLSANSVVLDRANGARKVPSQTWQTFHVGRCDPARPRIPSEAGNRLADGAPRNWAASRALATRALPGTLAQAGPTGPAGYYMPTPDDPSASDPTCQTTIVDPDSTACKNNTVAVDVRATFGAQCAPGWEDAALQEFARIAQTQEPFDPNAPGSRPNPCMLESEPVAVACDRGVVDIRCRPRKWVCKGDEGSCVSVRPDDAPDGAHATLAACQSTCAPCPPGSFRHAVDGKCYQLNPGVYGSVMQACGDSCHGVYDRVCGEGWCDKCTGQPGSNCTAYCDARPIAQGVMICNGRTKDWELCDEHHANYDAATKTCHPIVPRLKRGDVGGCVLPGTAQQIAPSRTGVGGKMGCGS